MCGPTLLYNLKFGQRDFCERCPVSVNSPLGFNAWWPKGDNLHLALMGEVYSLINFKSMSE